MTAISRHEVVSYLDVVLKCDSHRTDQCLVYSGHVRHDAMFARYEMEKKGWKCEWKGEEWVDICPPCANV